MRAWLARECLFVAGALVLLVYLCAPFVWAAITCGEGYVWTSFADQYASCGDFRFYFAGVVEGRESFFSFQHPVTAEVGSFAIDQSKWVSYRWMVLLSAMFSDPRLAYLAAFVGSVLCNYVLFYLLMRRLTAAGGYAVLASFGMVFLYPLIWTLAFYGWQPAWVYLCEKFFNASGALFFEDSNDNFRFMVLSGSISFLWWAAWLVIGRKRPMGWAGAAAVALLLVLLPYTYISVTVISGLLLVCYGVVVLCRGQRDEALRLGAAAFSAALLLWLVGFFDDLHAWSISMPKTISESHMGEVGVSAADLWRHLRYSLPLLLLAAWVRRRGPLDAGVMAGLATLLLMQVLGLCWGKLSFLDRSLTRGYSHLWWLLAALLLWRGTQREGAAPKLQNWRTWACLALLCLPLVGGLRMAAATPGLYRLEAARHEVYQYLSRESFRNRNVLSLDYEDLQLLPLYTDCDLLVYGAEYIADPAAQLLLLARGMHLLGAPRQGPRGLSQIEGWLARYLTDALDMRCPPVAQPRSREEMRGFHTLKQLLYDPYNKTFAGHLIRVDGKLGRPFLAEVGRRLDRAVEMPLLQPDLVILRLDTDMLDTDRATAALQRLGYRQVFANDKFLVLDSDPE